MDADESPFHPAPTPPRRGLWVLVGLALAIAAAVWLFGREEIEQIRDSWRAETPHEEYLKALHDAGLAGTALTQAWIREAAAAVENPRTVELPFQEETFIAADAPEAVGYRFAVTRGQRIHLALSIDADEAPRVFLDLFRVPEDPADPLRPVTEFERGTEGVLSYEPTRSGEYVVRLQPELLREGRFRLTLEATPALAFPVEGRDSRAILSFFGADRDAGRRVHHGVDVFAPRGTPVLASAAGRVGRVEVTNLGGKVVWLRDHRGRNLYYAHLDSQYVRSGAEVEEGDTLGFVGNSGNARTTPPHLHYGIYIRGEGPVDPYPFLVEPRGRLVALDADLERLGTWGRAMNEGMRLRATPGVSGAVLQELDRHTAVRIVGAAGSWYRVRLPDGASGYLSARLVDDLSAPVSETVPATALEALSRPEASAPVVQRVAAGAALPVLGRFEDYLFVREPAGRTAWIRADDLG
ncbi:M23 family metallopeptidase [Gaopeijia maritima]|uniref:peptidoglycan DD-metalloendopeptidase family protein n=1 Tax=Gaopeijia maritima TaxID=3119007 RepID=UPI00324925CA